MTFDEWYKEIEDEEYENEYDYYDEDEVWYQRQEEMSKCVCGSYQWLERYKQFIKIADCICGF